MLILQLLFVEACSSIPKNEYIVRKLVPTQLKVRRPIGLGADPHASPGGLDYRSQTPQNEVFHCINPKVLFKEIPISEIKNCLISIQSQISITYRLIRAPMPFLELISEKEVPECFKNKLTRIPVPREIIFRAPPLAAEKEGALYCYSSRLNIEANDWMGVKLPSSPEILKIELPIKPIPADEEALVRLLTSWAITPFWDKEHQGLKAKILPDHLCKKCIGEEGWHHENHAPNTFWPY